MLLMKEQKEKKKEKGKRAPWMEIALKVAKEMKGCVESKEPMYSNAKKYLQYCNNFNDSTDGVKGPWCAAFLNWTIGQTKIPGTQLPYSHAKSASSLAPLWTDKYKKISEPIYGCLVVYRHINKKNGHIGFLMGKTKTGKYILLGGNQNDTIRFDSYGEYTSSSKLKKLYGFYIPKDYNVKEVDKLTEEDIYDSANDINKKYGIITVKSSGKTN
jgi:uncharacterized protein (TIGR02594 family)